MTTSLTAVLGIQLAPLGRSSPHLPPVPSSRPRRCWVRQMIRLVELAALPSLIHMLTITHVVDPAPTRLHRPREACRRPEAGPPEDAGCDVSAVDLGLWACSHLLRVVLTTIPYQQPVLEGGLRLPRQHQRDLQRPWSHCQREGLPPVFGLVACRGPGRPDRPPFREASAQDVRPRHRPRLPG